MRATRLQTKGLRWIFGSATACALVPVVAACEGDTARSEACLPGDFEVSVLADGGSGFLECNLSGTAYEPYEGPNPNLPPDSGPTSSVDASDADAVQPSACSTAGGVKLGFMCPGCTMDGDCQTGLVCFDFPNKTGNICTRACTPAQQSTLCPAPSEGCGHNGHCKP